MARPRKPDNQHFPPGVYRDHGRLVYRKVVDGKLDRGVVICRDNAPLSQVWMAYENLIPKREMLLKDLVERYQESDRFRQLAVKTRKDFAAAMHRMLAQSLASGEPFGNTPVAVITPGVMRKYLDHKKDSPVAANRQIAYLSSAFSWAFERDMVASNPCKGVRRNVEKARTRYVTDEEYARVYELAGDGPAYIRPAMELAYLCRMRINEVLTAKWSDVTEAGFIVRRSKGSRDGLTLWSDRLRQVIDLCRSDAPVRGMTLLHGKNGGKLSYDTFGTAWQRLMGKAKEAGVESFTFHDLKAKGISDFEGDKQKAGGHKTAAMVAVYDRKLPKVDSTR